MVKKTAVPPMGPPQMPLPLVCDLWAHLIATLEARLRGFGSLLHLGDEDAVTPLQPTQDGEVQNFVPRRPRQGHSPHLGFGRTGHVQQTHLAHHAL